MLNVNSDGTAGSTVCPNARATASPADDLLPPVAISTRSAATTSPVVSSIRKVAPAVPGGLSPSPTGPRGTSLSASIPRTPTPVTTRTPAAAAARCRHSTIVAESSVTGNIRPSFSVFNSTPRAANHATVSRGWNRENAPISSRPPRGYFFTSSRGSKHACVTLHRPPPEIRTFASKCAVASYNVTAPPASAAVMAAKNPAAPPPTTTMRFCSAIRARCARRRRPPSRKTKNRRRPGGRRRSQC